MPSRHDELFFPLLVAFFFLLTHGAHAESGYRRPARALADAATVAGIERAAVLPFTALDGADPAFGRIVAEELSVYLSSRLDVATPASGAAGLNIDTLAVAETASFDIPALQSLAENLGAQGLIAGSLIDSGGALHAFARLIDARTGAILASEKLKLRKSKTRDQTAPERRRQAMRESPEIFTPRKENEKKSAALKRLIQSREKIVATPEDTLKLNGSEIRELRDAASSSPCAQAKSRMRELTLAILPHKARYWAAQVKRKKISKGAALAAATKIIVDEQLKSDYAELFEMALTWKTMPLSREETRRFIDMDGLAYQLYQRCGAY